MYDVTTAASGPSVPAIKARRPTGSGSAPLIRTSRSASPRRNRRPHRGGTKANGEETEEIVTFTSAASTKAQVRTTSHRRRRIPAMPRRVEVKRLEPQA